MVEIQIKVEINTQEKHTDHKNAHKMVCIVEK